MDGLFDLEQVYDEQINPLMTQIIAICKEHQMPMVCSFAYKNDDETGVSCCSTALNSFDGRIVPVLNAAVQAIRGEDFMVAIVRQNRSI
ncbi:hypothetical protein [Phytobacter diazotrophicus]|uniref:hypothetical protein n=1 Tax=Phytobacter diazotrophicus TaxID=395631 RepID=UPI002FF7445A